MPPPAAPATCAHGWWARCGAAYAGKRTPATAAGRLLDQFYSHGMRFAVLVDMHGNSRRWRRSCATWRPPAPRRPSSRATQPSDRSRPTRWSCSCPSGERGIWVRDNCERNLIEMFDSVYRQTGAAHKAGVIWSGRQLTTQRVDRLHLASGSKAERPPLDQDRRPLPRPRRTPP